MRHLSTLLLLIVSVSLMAQSTIESIPNQKLINNSYVSNPDKIISDGTVVQIDTLLTSLEKKTSVQVSVVLVNSIGDEDVFEFAQKLFTTWGIGNKEKDNGLLLLFVNDKRTVRFHTGYGLEGVLPDITCKRIQRDFMIPEFKNGNYDGGILAGLAEVNKILTDPTYAAELQKPDESEADGFQSVVIFLSIFVLPFLIIAFIIKFKNNKFSDSKNPEHSDYPEMRKTKWTWLIEFIGLPVLIVLLFGISTMENPGGFCVFALYFYFMFTLFFRLYRMNNVINRFLAEQKYYEIVEFLRKDQIFWFWMIFLFPFPVLFYFFYHLARKKLYRNHSRNCKLCQGNMSKLSEQNDDQFLSKKQQMEESLHSIDYDVWQCQGCKATEEWTYPNKRSKYSACPKCNTWAYYSSGRSTIKSATYSSSGKGEETRTCKFCGHTKKSTYTIAQLVASTSSSSSSFSSGSSSSGGSWGGGSSGGGGASSSW
ncbi:MAG: TPM domain-containing protein [Chryseolinea sp.]